MARQLQNLQPLAWTVADLPESLRYISVLRLPEPFRRVLRDLPRRQKGHSPPVNSLHDTLAAASYSIIAFAPINGLLEQERQHWLYATGDTSLDTNRLRILFNKWVEAVGSPHKQIGKDETVHYDWDQIDLMQADYRMQRMVLPNLIARWLIAHNFEFASAGQQNPLRLVPMMSQRYEAELITEPLSHGDEHFSFVMRFWLALLPGESAPVLLHKTGLRRWYHRRVFIGSYRGKSLYLRRQAGYLDRASPQDVFTRLQVRNYKFPNIDYVGRQADLLDLLPLQGLLPPLDAFLKEPARFSQSALMPIENRDSAETWVKVGLEPTDHREIFTQLETALSPIASPLPQSGRVKSGDRKRGEMGKVTEQLRQDALMSMPYPLCVEVHSKKQFRKLAQHILDMTGFSHVSVGDTSVQVTDSRGNVCLDVRQIDDKTLTDTLTPGDRGSERVKYVQKHYPRTDIPQGTLIELRDYSQIKKLSKQDPKQAIRTGMTITGHITQFFVPEADKPESVDYRLEKSAADLLRMLGYRPQPFYIPHPQRELPENMDILAFWLFQLNKRSRHEQTVYLPVVAEVPYGHRHMRLIVPGPSGRSVCYSSLPEAIIALAGWGHDFADDREVISFFHAAIEERSSKNPALLLLPDAKLRRIFDELRDVSQNTLSLYGMLDERPHIRVSRLRFSSDDDAPFCAPPIPKSKYQGQQ